MATGEVIEAEELGGAKVHGTMTGLADQMASDEYELLCKVSDCDTDITRFDAITKAREWVATLQVRNTPAPELIAPIAPRYSAEDLLAIVNPDIRKPFDMKEVILRLVDDSRLSVFKPRYGPNMVTAWAHIMGKGSVFN